MLKPTESQEKNGKIIKREPHPRKRIWTIQIVANYPQKKKKNKRNEWYQTGSFHVRIKNWDLDLRGIHYCICRRRVWISMPSKKGILKGKECDFPILDFQNKDKQKSFIKLLQLCFLGFMKSAYYKSYEEEKKNNRSRKMNFIDVTPQRSISKPTFQRDAGERKYNK